MYKAFSRRAVRCLPLVFLTLASCSAADGFEGEGEETQIAQTKDPLTMTWSGPILQQSGVTDVTVVSPSTHELDMFVARSGGIDHWRYANGWSEPGRLTLPGVTLTQVAAVKNGSRIDLVARGSNRRLYWTHSTSPSSYVGFTALNTPLTESLATTNIALSSWSAGRLDLFWVTPSGNIGHSWATSNIWRGSETGDTSAKKYLQPLASMKTNSLEAVSWGSGRIDIMFVGNDGRVHHHWYDLNNGGWGPSSAPHRMRYTPYRSDAQQDSMTPLDLALSSRGSGKLDAFVFGRTPGAHTKDELFISKFSNGWFTDTSGRLRFELVNVNGSAASGVDSAVRWGNSGLRLDVFDAHSFGVWQSYLSSTN